MHQFSDHKSIQAFVLMYLPPQLAQSAPGNTANEGTLEEC